VNLLTLLVSSHLSLSKFLADLVDSHLVDFSRFQSLLKWVRLLGRILLNFDFKGDWSHVCLTEFSHFLSSLSDSKKLHTSVDGCLLNFCLHALGLGFQRNLEVTYGLVHFGQDLLVMSHSFALD